MYFPLRSSSCSISACSTVFSTKTSALFHLLIVAVNNLQIFSTSLLLRHHFSYFLMSLRQFSAGCKLIPTAHANTDLLSMTISLILHSMIPNVNFVGINLCISSLYCLFLGIHTHMILIPVRVRENFL